MVSKGEIKTALRQRLLLTKDKEIGAIHAGLEEAIKITGLEVPTEQLRQMSLLPVVGADEQDQPAEDGQRRPGRPAGSRNKSTEAMKDYLLSRYRNPLEFLAETYSRPAAQLAAELDCEIKDAFALQVACAKELAPYVMQKQPIAVQVDSKGVVQLTIDPGLDLIGQNTGDDAIIIEADDLTKKNEVNQ